VLDVVAVGRPVAGVAVELGIIGRKIQTWARQNCIDQGLKAGLSSGEEVELAKVTWRIHQLEVEHAGHPAGLEAGLGGGAPKEFATPQ
jgi:hypothetical protein